MSIKIWKKIFESLFHRNGYETRINLQHKLCQASSKFAVEDTSIPHIYAYHSYPRFHIFVSMMCTSKLFFCWRFQNVAWNKRYPIDWKPIINFAKGVLKVSFSCCDLAKYSAWPLQKPSCLLPESNPGHLYCWQVPRQLAQRGTPTWDTHIDNNPVVASRKLVVP